MLGLFLRKNFYEGWDNVVYFLVPNLLMDLVVLLASVAMWFGKEYLLVWGIAIFVAIILLSILSVCFITYKESKNIQSSNPVPPQASHSL